jgi:hypothetical protein
MNPNFFCLGFWVVGVFFARAFLLGIDPREASIINFFCGGLFLRARALLGGLVCIFLLELVK